jgi:hypothetical protein
MWEKITNAPFDRDLELAVFDHEGPHALVFPCRRILGGWMNAQTRARLDVHPTHWRLWPEQKGESVPSNRSAR